MVRDLEMAKEKLEAIQTCSLTWVSHLHSTHLPPDTSLRFWLPPTFSASVKALPLSYLSHSRILSSSTRLLNQAQGRYPARRAGGWIWAGRAGLSTTEAILLTALYNGDPLKISLGLAEWLK
jgi:hypothetical protein